MSDQSKHYDYYLVEGPEVKSLIDGYNTINEQRNDILEAAIESVGAIAWTNNSRWGDKGDLLESFVWEKGFEFPCLVTVKKELSFEGKRVVIARGKGNTKEGREYNKQLDKVKADANQKLKDLPIWQSYIINHYDIMRTGIGGRAGNSGFGMAMLSTYGGKHPTRDDTLLFAIPNDKEDRHREVVIPDNFQKLTYGQFYDITEGAE
ncbi:Eac protein [Pseudescherichia sp.]|uniref:Eac protein n=1 Tax=Pseudescherichia sp. TaxID=2055881 RepID=UPI0028A1F234|nr:Eac protein [Pseudescherichia sp.]